MFTSFKELEAYVLGCGMKKRIALANAHDEPALSAVVNARRKGVVEGTLVGKKNEIIAMLHEMGESEKDYEIVDFDGEELDAAKATADEYLTLPQRVQADFDNCRRRNESVRADA